MIGQDQLGQKPTMTEADKKKLYAILTEMKARGLEIPKNIKLPTDTVSDDWGQDERGYFVKKDGTKFNPRDELVDFINDSSRFILLKSGRGGGKTTAGVQKALRKVKAGQSGAVMNPDFENFRTSTWH